LIDPADKPYDAEGLRQFDGLFFPSSRCKRFWGVLALVVIGLLILMGRLLPKDAE
jgi:hypothetical protein